jgi:hypothetical protein
VLAMTWLRRVLMGCAAAVLLAHPGGLAADTRQDGFVTSGQGTLPAGMTDIDQFWQRVFRASATTYRPPAGVYEYQGRIDTRCGPADDRDAAFYCRADETIYLSPAGLLTFDLVAGDFSFVAVLAHDWGHHIQLLTGVGKNGTSNKAVELQADCLAGAYTADAASRGRLNAGDVTEAVQTAINASDRGPGETVDPHGYNDERLTAFMQGYINGLAPCSLKLFAPAPPAPRVTTSQPAPAPAPAVPPPASTRPAATYLPASPAVGHGGCFSIQGQGTYPAGDVDAFLSSFGVSVASLGWLDGAYLDFRFASPPAGNASYLGVVIHRFSTPAAAVQAAGYWQAGHGVAWNEAYLCTSVNSLVVCADGIGPGGAPSQDARALLGQLVALGQ